jgi:hypothetical protein
LDTFDDLQDINSLQLDPTTVESMINGAVDIDDAPPGFGLVVGLIDKAQGPATAEELAARATTVRTFAAKVRSLPDIRPKTKLAYAFPKFAAKVLALSAPVVLLAGGVVAATGSLPPSAQTAVSGALSNLGISVPKPHNERHGIALLPPSSTGYAAASGTGSGSPDTRSRATVGLCRAWRAGRLSYDSTAYRNLTAVAGGAGNLSAHCAGALALPDAAPRHVEKASSRPLHGGQGGTKASTTVGTKTVVHTARPKQVHTTRPKQEAIAVRGAGAVERAPAAASTSAQAATTLRHGSKALAISRPPVRSPVRPPVTAGVAVTHATHRTTTATAQTRRHRPSKKAGERQPTSKSSTKATKGTSGTTSPVSPSPIPSSTVAGGGSSQLHGHPARLRRPRGCPDSARPGHVIRTHHDCQPATLNGSTSNVTSPTTSGPSVASKPRSVKHRKRM